MQSVFQLPVRPAVKIELSRLVPWKAGMKRISLLWPVGTDPEVKNLGEGRKSTVVSTN
jgi:hypothetical protein